MEALTDPHGQGHGHGHSHDEEPVSPLTEVRAPGIPRIGIGGPVGSGKTALIEALVPMLIASGHRPVVVTNDIFTSEDALHVRRTLASAFHGGWCDTWGRKTRVPCL